MPAPVMVEYVALVARLVPLLLMTSALLAGTKWIHTRLSRRPAAANVAAAAFCFVMLALVVPYAAFMSLTAGATWSLMHNRWSTAAQRLSLLEAYGVRMAPRLHYGYGVALLHLGDFGAALREFELASHAPVGDIVPLVLADRGAATAAYFLGRDDVALQHLHRMPDSGAAAAERDYLLGRIAEKHGRVDVAATLFRGALTKDPAFHPALYRLLRIASVRHDAAGARAMVAEFVRRNPAEANAPYLQEIMAAIERGEVLADYEPYTIAE